MQQIVWAKMAKAPAKGGLMIVKIREVFQCAPPVRVLGKNFSDFFNPSHFRRCDSAGPSPYIRGIYVIQNM